MAEPFLTGPPGNILVCDDEYQLQAPPTPHFLFKTALFAAVGINRNIGAFHGRLLSDRRRLQRLVEADRGGRLGVAAVVGEGVCGIKHGPLQLR